MATVVTKIYAAGDEQGECASVTVTYDNVTFAIARVDAPVVRGRLIVLVTRPGQSAISRDTTSTVAITNVPSAYNFNPALNSVNKARFDFAWRPS